MIRATIPMQIFVCIQPTDMRRSFDGLSGMVRQVLSQDPLSGAGPPPSEDPRYFT